MIDLIRVQVDEKTNRIRVAEIYEAETLLTKEDLAHAQNAIFSALACENIRKLSNNSREMELYKKVFLETFNRNFEMISKGYKQDFS